uniref:Gamma-tubulin complex component n=1 Tax=Elaeophora elaphi TaxID=1147741 RepID=A0A0R3RFN5_9BILA
MYRNETLQLDGDSIWGRITLLLSSLIGRPCTGSERAQFYEDILLRSLKKQEEAKFFSLKFNRSKLHEATDSSEEIIRFLLLLSKIGDNYAEESQTDISLFCSGFKILNVWKQAVHNHLSTSSYLQLRGENIKEIVVQHQPCHSGEKTVPTDANLSKSSGSYEKIRRIIIDERGRVHPRACDPELRSLCKLRIGDVFYIISWNEYLRCLTHVLLGEESILFRRNADGFFSISRKNKIFLELEDINLLPRLAFPFLKFANRLFSLEQFLCDSGSMEDSSILDCKIRENITTRALLNLKLSASEQLWKFRDEIRHYVDDKKVYDSEIIRSSLRELLDMCSIFNHFVDIVLHVQSTGVRDVNTLLDIFYIVKITKGQMVPGIAKFCDNVLVALLRLYAECILFWLVKGEADTRDGVFSFSETSTDILQWTVSGGKKSIDLEASMLVAKNFIDAWLSEGKFRKLILAWPNLKQLAFEELSCVTVNKLINELSEDEIRKALNSELFGAVGSLLDFHFQKVYLSQHTIFARCCIIDDFKQTAKLLRDVYLCDDEYITEIFVSALLNGEIAPNLDPKSGNYQNFRLDEVLDYLLTKNYSPTLVHGFSQLTSSSDKEDDLRVRYKPPFPLNIIFASSVLMNYERIWNLLLRIAVECTALEKMMVQKTCIYSTALMQMRMWNFVRAMRYFFHEQIRHIIVNEYQEDFDAITTIGEAFQLHRQFVKKMYRHCLLGRKHVKLWNVLEESLVMITKYRRCSLESFNILKLFKVFNDFHNSVDLFCNAVKRTSVGADYWLSDLLLLADFSGIYTDLDDGSSLNPNWTTLSLQKY